MRSKLYDLLKKRNMYKFIVMNLADIYFMITFSLTIAFIQIQYIINSAMIKNIICEATLITISIYIIYIAIIKNIIIKSFNKYNNINKSISGLLKNGRISTSPKRNYKSPIVLYIENKNRIKFKNKLKSGEYLSWIK